MTYTSFLIIICVDIETYKFLDLYQVSPPWKVGFERGRNVYVYSSGVEPTVVTVLNTKKQRVTTLLINKA